MAGCLKKNYLPIPPRLWERTNATCEILFEKLENGTVFYPYFNKKVTISQAAYLTKMLYKGNILQYPSPSTKVGGMTKKMNYARIVKGFGKYRKNGWASQTDSYTSPNSNMLHRNQYSITSNNLNGEIKLPGCDDDPFIENVVLLNKVIIMILMPEIILHHAEIYMIIIHTIICSGIIILAIV